MKHTGCILYLAVMDFVTRLSSAHKKNDSLVCIGLDPDVSRLPEHLKSSDQPIFEFNKSIIDATADQVCTYKPNSAFYEAFGLDGIHQLKQTCEYIREKYPHIPIILDAKRADIGNTNNGYVEFAYSYLQADAITLHAYLGKEALEPFLSLPEKGAIILCRTSNPGAGEFQDLTIGDRPLYEHIAKTIAESWNENNNCLLVVGATYTDEMKAIRKLVGDMPLLVPGVGAQGGSVKDAVQAGINSQGEGVIISSSRDVIYASTGENFAEAARAKAMKLREEINLYR